MTSLNVRRLTETTTADRGEAQRIFFGEGKVYARGQCIGRTLAGTFVAEKHPALKKRRRRIVETTKPGCQWRAFRVAKRGEVLPLILLRYLLRHLLVSIVWRFPGAGPCPDRGTPRIDWPGIPVYLDGRPQLWHVTGETPYREWLERDGVCHAKCEVQCVHRAEG